MARKDGKLEFPGEKSPVSCAEWHLPCDSFDLSSEFKKIRFGEEAVGSVGVGFKPVSKPGTERLVRSAIEYAIAQNRKSVTLVHKGNIMKYTEGAFRDWGYELAKAEFGAVEIDGGPWCRLPNGINDVPLPPLGRGR